MEEEVYGPCTRGQFAVISPQKIEWLCALSSRAVAPSPQKEDNCLTPGAVETVIALCATTPILWDRAKKPSEWKGTLYALFIGAHCARPTIDY
jgi:hypothetical protein